MLRTIAEEVASAIENDETLGGAQGITVVVEDKANLDFEVEQALGRLGVCVIVAIAGFRPVDRSPILQGTVEIEVSCLEHPILNRDSVDSLTAQNAMECIARALHYTRLQSCTGQLIFKNMTRSDVDGANVVIATFEVNAKI